MVLSSRVVAFATTRSAAVGVDAAPLKQEVVGSRRNPRRRSRSLARLAAALAIVPAAWLAVGVERAAAAPVTERVSVSSAEAEAYRASFSRPAVSGDGRYVVFVSDAQNLVAGDRNGSADLFVRDRVSGTTETVLRSSAGVQGGSPGASFNAPAITPDGRYVAFAAGSGDLVPGDTNGNTDIFVRDRTTGTTERVSVSSSGGEGNASSFSPSISDDGRLVTFDSNASDLVTGDGNGVSDVFVHDRTTNVTERVSVDGSGADGTAYSERPSISGDGRFVAFQSDADNFVPGDTNARSDIFVRDLAADTTERASLAQGGGETDDHSFATSISGNGRYVTYVSGATNVVAGDTNNKYDVFVFDRDTGANERVSVDDGVVEGDQDSVAPAISGDGRYVSFESYATNLVAGDTNGSADVFRRDRTTGTTIRSSVSTAGAQADDGSYEPGISRDSSVVAFRSFATDLVADDINEVDDMFVRDDSPPDPPVPADPYADAVAPSSAAIVNGSRVLGAPDGRRASIVGILGGQATFDMGAGEEGTGDLTVYYGGLTLQWTTTVSFLDGRGRTISSGPLLFTLGANQTGTVTFRGRTPYRYVRFTAGLLQAFGLDAVRAASIVT